MEKVEEKFKIIRIKKNIAYLQAIKTQGCGSCSANKGCGVGVLSQYFGGHLVQNTVKKDDKVGDIVILSISGNRLLYHAFLLYILPLLCLFLGALLAGFLFPNAHGYQVIFGLIGFGLSFVIIPFALDFFKAFNTDRPLHKLE